MRKLIIILAFCLFGCTTTSTTSTSGNPSDYVPKFSKGDCVTFNSSLIESWEISDGTQIKVKSVTKRHYVLSYVHLRFGIEQASTVKMISFNRNWVKTSCKKATFKDKTTKPRGRGGHTFEKGRGA